MISTLKEAYQQKQLNLITLNFKYHLEQNDLIKNLYVSIINKNIL